MGIIWSDGGEIRRSRRICPGAGARTMTTLTPPLVSGSLWDTLSIRSARFLFLHDCRQPSAEIAAHAQFLSDGNRSNSNTASPVCHDARSSPRGATDALISYPARSTSLQQASSSARRHAPHRSRSHSSSSGPRRHSVCTRVRGAGRCLARPVRRA